jgi:hypothetical protein
MLQRKADKNSKIEKQKMVIENCVVPDESKGREREQYDESMRIEGKEKKTLRVKCNDVPIS